jgi:copper chaperone CopZ
MAGEDKKGEGDHENDQSVDGVEDVKISLEKGEATFDEMKPVDMSVIKEKIRKAGFDVG